MTRLARAYYGAMIGALASLALHPVSRPFLLAPFTAVGPSPGLSGTPLLTENLKVLPKPKSKNDLHTFAVWLQAGAESMAHKELSDNDAQKLVRMCRLAIEAEPDNALWPLMGAAFLGSLNQHDESLGLWQRGSVCTYFNDYQSDRLLEVRRDLAGETGSSMAWQLRLAYDRRRPQPIITILSYGRELVDHATMDREGLLVRLTTMKNAVLVRDGARSIAYGQLASALVESCTRPHNLPALGSHKRLLLAREQFHHRLVSSGLTEEAATAISIFRFNDAWAGLTSNNEEDDLMWDLTLTSLLTSTLPGICLILALFGGLIWFAGWCIDRFPKLHGALQPPIAPVVGALLAVTVYYLTSLPLAAMAVVLCFTFLIFSPPHERSHPPNDLGPLFGFVLAVLGIGVFASLGAFLLGMSRPGAHLLPLLGVPPEYYNGSTLFLGLGAIVMGLLLLAAPSWALIERIKTAKVVAIAFRHFGSGLCAICLGLAVVSVPLAVYFDRQASGVLEKMVVNEPNYFILQQ
jgi:hypothetical protein